MYKNQISLFLLISIVMISLLNACGPSEEEIRQREQARQDSLERVRQQRLQQQRMDSIAKARADSIEQAQQEQQEQQTEKEQMQISFNENGHLSIQVESWRSKTKAQKQADKWIERGFDNAYVVRYGNESTGDIWFRVRLGKVTTKEMAESIGKRLQERYGEKYWIDNVQDEGSKETDGSD